jgi:putative transposase
MVALAWMNEALTAAELERVRQIVQRGRPYGREEWTLQTAQRLGLEASLRPRGRPLKKQPE